MTPRPTNSDPRIIEFIAGKLAPLIDEEEGTLSDIMGALEDEHDWSAYNLCKYLDDNCYCDIDDTVTRVMDRAESLQWEHHQKLIKDWVRAEGIEPQFSWGDIVHFRRFDDYCVGEIAKVRRETAQYTVFVEALGHVRKGNGTHGSILNYENVW